MKFAPYEPHYIDQIAAYAIQAGEILSKDVGEINAKYRHFFLPQWSELYTWPLKAAWYLLLHPDVDHIVLIYKQEKYPQHITIYQEAEGIVSFGYHFSVVWLPIKPAKLVRSISEEVLSQLNFLTMLKRISKVTILWIGVEMDLVEVSTQLRWLTKSPKIGTIYYDTCSSHVSREEARSTDEKALSLILKKKMWDIGSSCRLANVFSLTLPQKSNPELLGYVNTWDFGGNQTKTTSYASIIG